MKTILYILALLLVVTAASASIELDRIKIYVEDVVVDSADEDGGDIDVRKDDLVEVAVTVENHYNRTATIELKGIIRNIDDGNDIEKKLSDYEIEADEERTKTLAFAIPSDARIDDYDMDIYIDWNLSNGTRGDFHIDYEIQVKVDKETEDTKRFEDSFNNLTYTCNNVISSMDSCFGYINRSDSLTDELSTCKEVKGTCIANYGSCNSTLADKKEDNDELEDSMAGKNTLITQLENDKKIMLTRQQCNNITAVKVSDAKSSSTQQLFFIALLGVGGWWFFNQKKKKGTVADTYYYEKDGR